MKAFVALFAFAALAFAQPQRPVETFQSKAGPIKITAIRHASLMMEAGGQVVHVDPWSQGNYDGLPPADLILITDVHGDHMDPKMLPKVKKASTVIVAPKAVAANITEAQALNNGESKTFGRWTIEAVAMYNEKRGPAPGKLYHDKGRGNGYVVAYGGMRFYLSGDTEGVAEMRALKNIDVAFLTMNLPFTMPPEEAAEAAKAFRPKIVYPYHYRGSDLAVFEKALAGSGIEVRIRDWYY
ncbi:MAG: MBL fold metallo-hydrolase [Acidobacteria bacterium]|nr:MBL fold metallo-hydrolase [Acidobacteriota bacterium]